jgi:membrane protease YdiL (CAAX protease family)
VNFRYCLVPNKRDILASLAVLTAVAAVLAPVLAFTPFWQPPESVDIYVFLRILPELVSTAIPCNVIEMKFLTLSDEILFRGIFITVLRNVFQREAVPVLLCSVLYIVVFWPRDQEILYQIFYCCYLFVASVIYGFMYIYCKDRLFGPILVHTMVSWFLTNFVNLHEVHTLHPSAVEQITLSTYPRCFFVVF